MSLADICILALQDTQFAVPSSFIGNDDETAVRAVAAAQLEGQSLMRRPQGGWIASIREYDFTTKALTLANGTIANTGPNGVAVISGFSSDFNPADFNPVDFGGAFPVAPATWYAFGPGVANNSIVASVTTTSVTLNMAATSTGSGQFIFGQSDYALPTDFQRPIDNTMWDRSRFWSMRGPLSPQQWQLYKSSVIGRASIQRRFRFRSINGNISFSIDPVPTDNGSQLVFEYVSNAFCQSATGAAQSRWQADTDVGILDEYLMTLGVRWRVLRRAGLSYAEELEEYERQVSKAMATDGGAAILSLVSSDHLSLIGPWNLPETNFGNVAGS